MHTIQDIDHLTGQRVLIRCDFNVPLDSNGHIVDDARIRAALPTITYLQQHDARIILLSHLGRPHSAADTQFSLKPVATRLAELLNHPVTFINESHGPRVLNTVNTMHNGDIIVLENVRFNSEEKGNDNERQHLAHEYAQLGDLFISDGFGVVHRKQASVYDIAQLLPSAAGFLIQKEVTNLNHILNNPQHPLTVILGGSKVSDKIGVITNLITTADTLLICGGMSYTFLKAQGYEIGTSLVEPNMITFAQQCLTQAKEQHTKLLLPTDLIVTDHFAADAQPTTVPATHIPATMMGMDIGEHTRQLFDTEIQKSSTIFWNGPAGVFEFPTFAHGTHTLATSLQQATQHGAFTAIGGGDSVTAIHQFGFQESDFSYISTGGGASLNFLEGKPLPGLRVLD